MADVRLSILDDGAALSWRGSRSDGRVATGLLVTGPLLWAVLLATANPDNAYYNGPALVQWFLAHLLWLLCWVAIPVVFLWQRAAGRDHGLTVEHGILSTTGLGGTPLVVRLADVVSLAVRPGQAAVVTATGTRHLRVPKAPEVDDFWRIVEAQRPRRR